MKNFHFRSSHKLSEMFKEARKEGITPDWIGSFVWTGLLEKWNKPTYREKCDTTKKTVHQKKVEHYTPRDLLACMTMPFIWYDYDDKLLYLFI